MPFGIALDAESTGGSNRRFTSYDRSANTGLDYAVNRHYDSKQGRFTQVDPLGMGAANPVDPQTLNMYAYCGNDPVNHTDPDGLFFKKLFGWIGKAIKWIGIAVLVAAAVIAILYFAAPASSMLFEFTMWGKEVLLPFLAKYVGWTVPGGLFSTRIGGSPPWNQNSRGTFGNHWQGGGDFDYEDVIRIEVKAHKSVRDWLLYTIQLTFDNGAVSTFARYIRDNPDVLLMLVPVPAGWIGRGAVWAYRGLRGTRFAASSAAQAARLRTYYRLAEKYGQAGVKELQNGRFRFYGEVTAARKTGEMVGTRIVREWNPATGGMRTWLETLDAAGRVRIVRPEIGGSKLHYLFDQSGKFIEKF